jgi:hypothetical protein
MAPALLYGVGGTQVAALIAARRGTLPPARAIDYQTRRNYTLFGVEEYPSIDAPNGHIDAQRRMGFSQHIEEARVVGVPWES